VVVSPFLVLHQEADLTFFPIPLLLSSGALADRDAASSETVGGSEEVQPGEGEGVERAQGRRKWSRGWGPPLLRHRTLLGPLLPKRLLLLLLLTATGAGAATAAATPAGTGAAHGDRMARAPGHTSAPVALGTPVSASPSPAGAPTGAPTSSAAPALGAPAVHQGEEEEEGDDDIFFGSREERKRPRSPVPAPLAGDKDAGKGAGAGTQAVAGAGIGGVARAGTKGEGQG